MLKANANKYALCRRPDQSVKKKIDLFLAILKNMDTKETISDIWTNLYSEMAKKIKQEVLNTAYVYLMFTTQYNPLI